MIKMLFRSSFFNLKNDKNNIEIFNPYFACFDFENRQVTVQLIEHVILPVFKAKQAKYRV
jgi:hypothetical protein